ncbi:MAG: transglycosylase domain-containing protein [Bacteroidales bacterium]|jgi:penicillin-binding protein 1A|nr:transglycosylase domain-containing protein [Bacteroidales bacterium]MDX9798438.1 transglycosylase domain-containing protein [Bacteroidales bacterium]
MAQNKTDKRTKKTNNFSIYVRRMWKIFATFMILLFLFFFFLSLGWLGFMPSFEQLENPNSNLASEVYSADGEILGYIGIQNRSNVQYSDLPKNLIDALIATEDVRFYKHSGIDFKSLFRVLGKTILGGDRGSGGGSTITQQLAKNLFPREQKSKLGVVYSKLKEWVVAIKLERNYTKEEILTMYLNTVDFGSNAFGIKTASRTFFDKLPSELKVEESATLVGLLRAPTAYNPIRRNERSRIRRNTVLSQMAKYEFLEKEEAEKLMKTPLDISRYNPQSHDEGIATYFREYIRNYMKEWGKTHKKQNGESYDVHRDGLRIYTTIDFKMQRYAEEAVKEHFKTLQAQFYAHTKGYASAPFTGISKDEIEKTYLQSMRNSERYQTMKLEGFTEKEIRKAFNEKVEMRVFTWKGAKDTVMSPWDSLRYYKFFLNTGMVSIEPQTGHVKVYVGGIDYKYFKFDNAVQGQRQVGSTFKPFVYAAAMRDNELSPCFTLPNIPVTFEDFDNWTPRNSNNTREGEMISLKWALANSINYISANLIKNYTTPNSIISLVRKMGIKSAIPAVPSISLGTSDLSVIEMAQAMATFANRGTHIEPIFITRITDNKGVVLDASKTKSNVALDPQTSYLVIDLMKGVVESGTGRRLRYIYNLRSVIAGKTGTTDNNSDGWFIGINPRLATAVWVGGEFRSIHFRSTALGQGASMALPVYGLFMKRCEKDNSLKFYQGDFTAPENISIEMDCSKYLEEINTDYSTSSQTTTQSEYKKNW